MFKSISWSHYATAVAILAGLWYSIILIAYYRKELFNLFNGKYKIPVRKKRKQTLPVATEEDTEDTENTFEELEGIVTDIRHSILEKAGKTATKDVLLLQLQSRLASYGGLRQPAFRVAVNNFIIRYAESICGVAFSEEELDEAWDRLPR